MENCGKNCGNFPEGIEFRPMKKEEYPLLADFLYEAIFLPPGVTPPPREVVELPEVQSYIADFGKEGDFCLCAVQGTQVIGAAWCRYLQGYGNVEGMPELAVSLLPSARGQGVGTALLKRFLEEIQKRNMQGISLSVQKENPAHRLYERLGFEIVKEQADTWVMVCMNNQRQRGRER